MIVGRGGQVILRRQPGVLHVQVIAKFETRVYNIIQRESVKWREAAHRVRASDEQITAIAAPEAAKASAAAASPPCATATSPSFS